ncbi:flagellar hook-basal body complex protein FliE [Kiloniella laminariae]|uniref:Flagellar hook-basal body complex protein FliE n=1 Tax=Kiloniella laminariae TaxID=454162 RepID=A0ABT4LH94_9PROT|nr:flagellar hook-basal body complex protein FliE [Kiloniella laminariae]MCZ4280475.1 flagellar hook-basal body complex protein FliE [Kiloniella laminariae]
MAVNFSDAVSAYNRIAGQAKTDLGQDKDPVGADFASTLRGVAENTLSTMQNAETKTLMAASGKADVTDVVTAMSEAEVTLQTVVAVRDKVVQAYQEILRMPI